MNFRVQVFDRAGKFQYAIGKIGDTTGVDVPTEGGECRLGRRCLHCGCACGAWCRFLIEKVNCCITSVQRARMQASFNCPRACSSIMTTRCIVVDSFNRRIQVFQYVGLKSRARRRRSEDRDLLAAVLHSADGEQPYRRRLSATRWACTTLGPEVTSPVDRGRGLIPAHTATHRTPDLNTGLVESETDHADLHDLQQQHGKEQSPHSRLLGPSAISV